MVPVYTCVYTLYKMYTPCIHVHVHVCSEGIRTCISPSDTNKMTAVSLSIVFGPSVFHCGGGLEGMREQGYANSVLCRFIMYTNTLFQVF